MSKLIAVILRWIAHKLAILLLVLAVLVAGLWLRNEWVKLSADTQEIRQQQQIHDALAADLARLNREIERESGPLRAKLTELTDLEAVAAARWKAADEAKAKWDALRTQVGWYQYLMDQEKILQLEIAEQQFRAKHRVAQGAERLKNQFARGIDNSRVQELLDEKRRRESDLAKLGGLITDKRAAVLADPKQRLLAAVRSQLPTALWVLAGIILVPVAIKALFYYLLAPLAARLPPIRILPDPAAPTIPEPTPSAVSQHFDIAPGQEILVHSDFLQSSSKPARKRTQWFLNPRLPFSSIASGMFILTRIQPEDDLPTRVVVSSQTDAFGEIGTVDLPDGAVMVVQPRSLAGVVKRQGEPVHITRHWRLGSLHAWLTLQLRYLAFHGPCTLVLKGCRGVRAEQPDPERPRMINQSATIGFSANLDYHNSRCETFISYLRGKEDLFNDTFAGGPGRFVYEETPAAGRKTGITGRGLEGAVDAALKVFGI